MLQDLRYAIRLLGRSRAYAAAAVVTLALGIGANTAIFSIVDGAVLRPLPYPHSDRLVMFALFNPARNRRITGMTPRDFLDWRDQQQVFDFLVGEGGRRVRLLGGSEPEDLQVARVTAGFFETFGAAPALGRLFVRDDELPGTDRKVVVSDAFWRERLGGDPAVVGRTLRLDDQPYEVVGVLPASFEYPVWFKPTAVFMPMSFTVEDRQRGVTQSGFVGCIGRLKPGVTIEQAAARMSELQAGLDADHAPFNKGYTRVDLTPLVERLVFDARSWMLMLLGAVALVLLIACANVANLVLAHGSTRVREVTVRAALGAGRLRLARQLLAETLVLAVLGGAAGLLVGWWGLSLLRGALPPSIPRAASIAIDLRVLGFTTALTLATGLVCGLLPAFQGSRVDLVAGLRDASGATAAPRRHRLRFVLAWAEVALAVMLLIGAGLFIVSFARVVGVDRGFDGSGVVTASVSVPRGTAGSAATRTYFFDLKAAAERVPGVERVAIAQYDAPLAAGSTSFPLTVVGRPKPPAEGADQLYYRAFSAGLFEVLRIPVRRGRLWTDRDTEATPLVAVINETAARRYWPNEDPLGQRFVISKNTYEIIGVVGDIRYVSLSQAPPPEAYLAYEQLAPTSATLFVRTAKRPAEIASSLKSAVWSVNPNQAVAVGSIDANMRQNTARRRFNTMMMGIFALVALGVAATGIYGVMAFLVSSRTREMGVRLALGARGDQIAALVLRQGGAVIASGVLGGVLGAWWLSRTVESFLYGVRPRDPAVFAASALVLVLIAGIACWIPARRAARVDPIAALRAE